MENLIQNTLKKIRSERIAPAPSWKYLAKRIASWLLLAAAVFLGAASLSTAYAILSGLDFDLYRFLHENPLHYYASLLPYFWLALILIFLLAAWFDVRRTDTGYRFSLFKIFSIAVGGTVFLGLIFIALNFGGKLNQLLLKDVPDYKNLVVTKETQWMQPQNGFLAGSIQNVSANGFSLEDLNHKDWAVSTNENISVRPSVDVTPGEMIKIIGTQEKGNNFQAAEIRPWSGKQMRSNNQGGPAQERSRGPRR